MRWFLFEVKGNKSYFFFLLLCTVGSFLALAHCWVACFVSGCVAVCVCAFGTVFIRDIFKWFQILKYWKSPKKSPIANAHSHRHTHRLFIYLFNMIFDHRFRIDGLAADQRYFKYNKPKSILVFNVAARWMCLCRQWMTCMVTMLFD